MEVTVLKEDSRGCGFRHSGKNGYGLYLIGDGILEVCERLPYPITVCPCCGQGTKFSRGFTWIIPSILISPTLDPKCIEIKGVPYKHFHEGCYMCNPPEGKHGLLWVGEKYYSPASFLSEAMTRGVSKRIPSLPRGFEIGRDIVYLAHKKGFLRVDVESGKGEIASLFAQEMREEGSTLKPEPAIFFGFKPSRLEIVVDSTNIDEVPPRAKQIVDKFGPLARLVKVERTQQLTFLEEE